MPSLRGIGGEGWRMGYKVTVIADHNGNMYVGADKRQSALAAAPPVAEVKLYSSQLKFAISARTPDGRVLISTRTKARQNGWSMIKDHANNLIQPKPKRPSDKETSSPGLKLFRIGYASGLEHCAVRLADLLTQFFLPTVNGLKDELLRESAEIRRHHGPYQQAKENTD